MAAERWGSPLAVDLTRLGHRSVTSFYSNLITRPTGRAVRMGVESQLSELQTEQPLCISILDFSQVGVLDYSCADEIIAKLLLRYSTADRPAEAYFLARGLQEHQQEPVEAVLERHNLLLVVDAGTAEPGASRYTLLGPCDPLARACWEVLIRRRRAHAEEVVAEVPLSYAAVGSALLSLVSRRVALVLRDDSICALPALVEG